MTNDLIEFEGGEILANLEDRTITGLLIPYNEIGHTNIGRFQVEAGAIAIPADPVVVGVNTDHDRPAVVGRATRVWEEPRGVMATFTIAKTVEGDAALADAIDPNGKRRRLSGEFGPAMIKAGKLVAGHAKLWGAALVEAGAFPSAQVLAADTVVVEGVELPAESTTTSSYESSSTDGTEFSDTSTTTEDIEDLGEGKKRITRTTVTVTEITEAPPAEDTEEEGESTVTATEVAAGATQATIPASLRPVPAAQVMARAVDFQAVFAAMAQVKANPNAVEAAQVLAALTDIKITGAGSLPGSGAASLLQPNWLGELYQGLPYEREYIALGTLGTSISAAGKKGFKISRGTSGAPIPGPGDIPNGGDWAGNKAEINSYNGFTTAATSTLRRFAVGNDIAREFYDLPGGIEFVEAFVKLLLEDHLYWSDTNALEDIVTAAGAPVAPATADFPTDYPEALGMLIQGILAVKARKTDGRRDVPTFAVANEAAYAELVYATGGEQNLPAFVNIAVSTNSNGTVDGNVQVVQGDTGIEDTASVIVGAKRAIEFDELPGGPLLVDALEVAKGGIDRAVHGYLQTFVVRPEAIVLVGTADTP